MRKRALIIGGVVATLSLIAGAFALIPAKADPAGIAVDGNNGYRTQVFEHPDNESWTVSVAVDTQRGVNEDTNATFVSGVGRISKGAGVKRVQVDAVRVALGGSLYNDYFPSKTFGARDNTPAGCSFGFDDVSTAVGCQPGKNPLNSAGDYSPDTSLVRGYSDWIAAPCGAQTMAARVFVAVRWADNSYSKFSLRTTLPDPEANQEC